MGFIKTVLRNVAVNLVSLIVLLILMLSISAVLMQTLLGGAIPEVDIPESGALRVELNGILVDQKT